MYEPLYIFNDLSELLQDLSMDINHTEIMIIRKAWTNLKMHYSKIIMMMFVL